MQKIDRRVKKCNRDIQKKNVVKQKKLDTETLISIKVYDDKIGKDCDIFGTFVLFTFISVGRDFTLSFT